MSTVVAVPTFPHVVTFDNLSLTLRAENGRRRIVYDYTHPLQPGEVVGRREKKVIPTAELPGAGGEAPPAADESGQKAVPSAAIEWAQAFLELRAEELRAAREAGAQQQARQSVQVRVPNRVPLEWVLARYRETEDYRGRGERGQHDRVMQWVPAYLDAGFHLDEWDQDTVDRLLRLRMTESRTVDGPSGPVLIKPCDHNTIVGELKVLAYIFRHMCKTRYEGEWVLDGDPFLRATIPATKQRAQKERVPADRMGLMMDHAKDVDPSGRLRAQLSIARWQGMRVGSIVQLARSNVLFTAEEIETALYQQKNRYVRLEEIPAVAHSYAECGGAIYWPAAIQKMAKSRRQGADQYDRVVPFGPSQRAELLLYIKRWDALKLPHTAPLFGADRGLLTSMHRDLAEKWWDRTENRIRAKGIVLRPLPGTRWHGCRLQRLYEFRQAGVEPKERYHIVGWSTAAGAGSKSEGQLSVAEGVYARAIPELLVKAVRTADPQA